MFDLTTHPLITALPDPHRSDILTRSPAQSASPGDVLFYQGDAASAILILLAGEVSITPAGQPPRTLRPAEVIDPVAALGGLPHTGKAVILSPATLAHISLDALAIPEFAAAARLFLADLLHQREARLGDIDAPLDLYGPRAEAAPGPFRFDDVSLLIFFCEADRATAQASLPPGLAGLGLAGSGRTPVFFGLAHFPNAYPEADPNARFAYTETTLFLPVNGPAGPGVFIPYISPSAWQPILIGREVYGFAKRPGLSRLERDSASLQVDGIDQIAFGWDSTSPSDEGRLVGALMGWLGLQRHAAELAFRAGDALRAVAGLPPHRRVDVYNHKRIPAPESTLADPAYDVDSLTHAVFGVLGWHSVQHLKSPRLLPGGALAAEWKISVKEGFRTQLDMRLSIGETVIDYRQG
jgi:hypothetical protein